MDDVKKREDGQVYTSPVVMLGACFHCEASFQQRAAGRTRKFCSPACRVAYFRAGKLF